MNEMTAAQRDKLLADMRIVVADAEELLRVGAGDLGEGARSMRDRLQASLGQAKVSLADLHAGATERVRAAGHVADDYVHENPWRSIGFGAAVGLAVGLLIGRR